MTRKKDEPEIKTGIQEYSKTEAALAKLREEYGGVTFDVTDPQGLKAAKAARQSVRTYRTDLEKLRQEIKAPALEHCRLIDAEAKRITAELRELEDPIDAQIKAEEQRKEREKQERIKAEQQRVARIQEAIRQIRETPSHALSATVTEIEGMIEAVEALTIDDDHYQEFLDEAISTRDTVLMALKGAVASAKEREADEKRIQEERAELARLREAEEKRQAEQRKKEEAERKAEQKRLEEQRKAQEAKEKELQAEADRQAKERAEREQAEAEEAERKRQAAEAAKRKEYPGDQAIIDALVDFFQVDAITVRKWLTELVLIDDGTPGLDDLDTGKADDEAA